MGDWLRSWVRVLVLGGIVAGCCPARMSWGIINYENDPVLAKAMCYDSETNGGDPNKSDRSLAEKYYLKYLNTPRESFQRAHVYTQLGAMYDVAFNPKLGEKRDDAKAADYFHKALKAEPERLGTDTIRARSMLSSTSQDMLIRTKATLDLYAFARTIDANTVEAKWLPRRVGDVPSEQDIDNECRVGQALQATIVSGIGYSLDKLPYQNAAALLEEIQVRFPHTPLAAEAPRFLAEWDPKPSSDRLSPEGALVRSYRPTWVTGDTWQVEVNKMSEPPAKPAEEVAGQAPRMVRTTYELKVEAREPFLGEDCLRVRIDRIAVDGNDVYVNRSIAPEPYYKIYVRDDYSLKAVERLIFDRGTEVVEAARHASRGPVAATGWVDRLPMEWPYFDANSMEFKPTNRIGPSATSGNMFDIGQQGCAEVKAGVSGKRGKALSVTITSPLGMPSGKYKTVEIWQRGLPWWVSAEHTEDGKTWSARLTQVNGRAVGDSEQ